MYSKLISCLLVLIPSLSNGHELTPTYPKLRPSYIDGVLVTDMHMWNRREDAQYYEINVYDEEWNPIPFAATERIFQLDYLAHKELEIYIRAKDEKKVEYICTTSKQLKEDVKSTGIKSMICSRIR